MYIYTVLSILYAAEKIRHQTNYPLIFGTIAALVTIILLALGIYAWRRCIRDKNTSEQGIIFSQCMNPFLIHDQFVSAISNYFLLGT